MYALGEVLHHVREKVSVDESVMITDRGGENWGVKSLVKYSEFRERFQCKVIWSPTCENHSGQPSDSSGGSFKSGILDDVKKGKLEGINSAQELVERLQMRKYQFKEAQQSKFLSSKTVSRTYHLLSASKVRDFNGPERRVAKLPGVSRLRQAFDTDERYVQINLQCTIESDRGKLLVRDSLCCCAACLDRNWAGCELKEYVPPPRPIMLGIDVDTTGAGDKSNQNLEVLTEQEGQADMFFELGETYAVRSEESNMGFFLFRPMSKSGEVLCGEMLTEKKSEKGRHGYVHYEVSEQLKSTSPVALPI